MKKLLVCTLLTCIIVTLACALTACNKDDDLYVLPRNTEVESITVHLEKSRTDKEIVGEERETLIKMLKEQPKLTKPDFNINIGKESQRYSPIYELKITTKKKFLKKSKTYSVMVGYDWKTTTEFGYESSGTSEDSIRVGENYGKISGDLFSYVKTIAEREDLAYFSVLYEKLKQKFMTEGYTVTDLPFDDDKSNTSRDYIHSERDEAGFKAVKNEESINVILCKSDKTPANYVASAGGAGHAKVRVYFVGTTGAYQIVWSVL